LPRGFENEKKKEARTDGPDGGGKKVGVCMLTKKLARIRGLSLDGTNNGKGVREKEKKGPYTAPPLGRVGGGGGRGEGNRG